MLTSFIRSKVTRKLPRTIFQCYNPGTLISFAVQNLLRLFILSRVLKIDKLEGAYQKRNLGIFFYTIE